MATVRAKFYCETIIQSGYSNEGRPVLNPTVTYRFKPVYSNDPNHENKLFWDATPSGTLEMIINNKAAQIFELGKEYYLDFTPVN